MTDRLEYVPACKVWVDDYIAVKEGDPVNRVSYRSAYGNDLLIILETPKDLTYHVWLPREQYVWKRRKARQPAYNMHISLPEAERE